MLGEPGLAAQTRPPTGKRNSEVADGASPQVLGREEQRHHGSHRKSQRIEAAGQDEAVALVKKDRERGTSPPVDA